MKVVQICTNSDGDDKLEHLHIRPVVYHSELANNESVRLQFNTVFSLYRWLNKKWQELQKGVQVEVPKGVEFNYWDFDSSLGWENERECLENIDSQKDPG